MSDEVLQRWLALGKAGVTVSICYGPSAGRLAWSVQAMGPDGDDFPMPFEARSPEHAIFIAETEAATRWGLTASSN